MEQYKVILVVDEAEFIDIMEEKIRWGVRKTASRHLNW